MPPNFRKNPLTGHWIIVAEGRVHRPNEFRADHQRQQSLRCPFCGGHEDDTPGEVAAFGRDGQPVFDQDWMVRVVPNKYPALNPFEDAHPAPSEGAERLGNDYSPYDGFQSGGVHELVVESRRHVVSFADLTRDEAKLSLRVYRERLKRVAENPSLAYGMVFKNCRPDAGASIEHTHSQLIGTPVVPASVLQHVERAAQHRQLTGRTLGGDIVRFERERGERVVAESDRFVAFCPFASHMAYETWLFPKTSQRSFLNATDGELDELAVLVHDCVKRIEGVLECPPYNLTLHLPPFDSSAEEDYQWHLELSPRLSKLAGFEWGTGCMILPVAPETAAARLREHRIVDEHDASVDAID